MAEWWQVIVPFSGAAGVAGWVGNVLVQRMKASDDRREARAAAEIDLEQHRDKLTFDLLSTARTELAVAKAELIELRPLQVRLAHIEGRLAHFEEAIGHLQALLATREPAERAQAERLAQAFVNRMRRLGEAQGTMLNEAQREQSAAAIGDEARNLLDGMPPA